MKKIFFETLKHKFGHYLLVILCGILMVSTIYVSYAFSDSIEGIIHGQNSGIVEEMYTFINFQETYILLFILMVLVIISYIQKKSYDYVLLDTMGLKKKHRYMFIGFEYAGIIFSSVTGGLILGKILAECAKTVLQNIFYNTITTEVNYGFIALRNTLVISCEVFGILFIVFDELIACLGMDALLTVGKKNGKPLKKRPKTLLIGIFLILIGLISLLFYWGKISQSIPTVFLNAGMCLLMISLAGYYFVRLNKKEKKYYKRITWLENWYHRFFYNINMSFVVAAFLVIIMTDFSIKLLDNLPITEPKNYPFDLVWMANTDDEEFLNHLTDDEGVELRKVPCARVTTTDIAEHMGIPASTYEKWTGKSLDLKDNEIFVVYQRERFERNKVGIGYNTKNPLIYIGKARADLWLYIKGVAAPKVQYFTEKFKVVGTEDRILTGVFGSETCEHIIVFSDEYYQKNCVKADGANMAVMMNIPENYDKVVEEIKAYAKDHSQVNYFDVDNGNLIYEKKELLLERSKTKLLYVASAAGNIIIMLLCGIFVLSIKMECDFPETEWKYRFYIQSGMSSAKVRKGIIKECLLSGGLPVICGTIISILYCSMLLYAKHLQIEWVHRYFKGIILIVGAIWLLFAVFSLIFAYRNIRKREIVEMEKSKKILKVENLKKAYYSTSRTGESITYPVLNNVSFEIEEGEFVGIMGRSGCGKTTLLKAVGMLDKPDDGTIYYKDKDTKDIYRAELARLRRTEIAFVFQDYYLMDSLSIKENIMLPLILDEADVQESKKKCEEMAEKFAITDLLDKKPYELSGGEKQRTAICRALIYNPDLILADEPTGNLDSASSEVVIHTLEEINKKMGKTILLVTHDPIIASSCDRIIFLKDGKVKEDLKRTGDKEQFYNEIITNWC